ncbi:ABC transporter substrate-binding protein [Methylobacterium aquaticum]|uniref:ABC transporter substrate-binding protein n=1 Tax=Methylobacterium aquaticum TaxID=270351 RepID=UPI003D185AC0
MNSDYEEQDVRRLTPCLDRRRLLRGMLAAGAAGPSFLAFAQALAAAPADTAGQLTILIQGGPVGDALRAVANPMFAKAYPKVSIDLNTSTNSAAFPRMIAQRKNPVIGGGMFNDLFAARGMISKIWAPLDPQFVTNAVHVPKAVRIPDSQGVTVQQTPFGIMYNPDRVEAPTSWTDLWNPKYRGRVSMYDSYFDAYAMASVASGGKPSVEDGIRAWAPHRENIGVWSAGPTSEQDMVHRGEVWLAPHWGGWVEQARFQGKNVRFALPKEGATLWSNQIQSVEGFSPLVTELVQRYLNTWLSPECQEAWLTQAAISPAIGTLHIPAELRDNPAIVRPEDVGSKLIRVDATYIATNFAQIQQLIQRTLKV